MGGRINTMDVSKHGNQKSDEEEFDTIWPAKLD
jgi:hypothetical protein